MNIYIYIYIYPVPAANNRHRAYLFQQQSGRQQKPTFKSMKFIFGSLWLPFVDPGCPRGVILGAWGLTGAPWRVSVDTLGAPRASQGEVADFLLAFETPEIGKTGPNHGRGVRNQGFTKNKHSRPSQFPHGYPVGFPWAKHEHYSYFPPVWDPILRHVR